MANQEEILLTQEGFDALQKELGALRLELPEVIKDVVGTRASGDLRENAPYHAAREKQAKLQGRIEELEHIIRYAQVVELSNDRDVVSMGSKVKVAVNATEREFFIVGEQESDINIGKISSVSPLGKSLMGKKQGETVNVNISGAGVKYQIISVS